MPHTLVSLFILTLESVYFITTFLLLAHLGLATREAQFSSAHSRPIAKDFVDGKKVILQ